MVKNLRVAFFPDSYLEVDGAAMTCRRLVDYAERQEYPLLCVHAAKSSAISQDAEITHFALKRSPFSFSLDQHLAYDPFFHRHASNVRKEIEKFTPDVIHITGLNDVSIIGAYLAWKMKIPLLGSWHTNLHEFAAQRLNRMLSFISSKTASRISGYAQQKILDGAVLYYKMPKIILSPNQELVEILGEGTGRTSRLMSRGVDPDKFSPAKRTVDDGIFRFGFVGRLRPEKNVRMLVDIERALINTGKTNFQFLIVGEGSDREFLEKNMQHVEFTGFLEGEALSTAYANMDAFVFPSETETFGNVTLEAHASGVPAVVSDQGGSKFLIEPGENGFVGAGLNDFVNFSLKLLDDPEKLSRMKAGARKSAMSRSWDAVFESVYDAYADCIEIDRNTRALQANGKG